MPDDAKSQIEKPQQSLTVVALDWAKDEGRRILTNEQYWHVVRYIKRLVEFGDKSAMSDLSISQLGSGFWALKLKGRILKKINLRIYFAHVPERNEIVVLMAYKKEEDRRVCPAVKYLLEDRLEDYLAGRTERASYFSGETGEPRGSESEGE
jgi:hypothetical protein